MSATVTDVRLMAMSLARTTGWHVFPCRPDKTPATPRGFKDACRHPDQIAALWDRHPAPLIGIACGAVSRHRSLGYRRET